MESTTYLCDDWGWFIDIENNKIVKQNHKLYKSQYTRVQTIAEEDEYDYYKKCYRDIEEDVLNCDAKINEVKKHETQKVGVSNYKIRIDYYKITPTTIITTAVLTYVLLYVL